MNMVFNLCSKQWEYQRNYKQDKCCGSFLTGAFLTCRLLGNNLFVYHNLGEKLKYPFKLFI
uniref:Alternative protein CCNE2 n=1 Tax=Homo sapiens TaxID=9606 RepID=L8EBC7_HUMAN|nr:alternative protein CCNE2 [Homo sapiens]